MNGDRRAAGRPAPRARATRPEATEHAGQRTAGPRPELRRRGLELPIYWGNRNWHPTLADAMRQMAGAGVRRALAVVLAAYSSYSSCRQYLEDIARAGEEAGAGAPRVDKVRVFFNHPDFV